LIDTNFLRLETRRHQRKLIINDYEHHGSGHFYTAVQRKLKFKLFSSMHEGQCSQ